MAEQNNKPAPSKTTASKRSNRNGNKKATEETIIAEAASMAEEEAEDIIEQTAVADGNQTLIEEDEEIDDEYIARLAGSNSNIEIAIGKHLLNRCRVIFSALLGAPHTKYRITIGRGDTGSVTPTRQVLLNPAD